MTSFLIVLIVSIFIIANNKASTAGSSLSKRRGTKTNVALQKKIESTFWEQYRQKLSFVDENLPTIKTSQDRYSLYDYIIDLYIQKGLPTDNWSIKTPIDHELEWNKFYISVDGKVENAEKRTLFERIMHVQRYRYMLGQLILKETQRSLWKKGYHCSYNGEESLWQELDKSVEESKANRIKYPWEGF